MRSVAVPVSRGVKGRGSLTYETFLIASTASYDDLFAPSLLWPRRLGRGAKDFWCCKFCKEIKFKKRGSGTLWLLGYNKMFLTATRRLYEPHVQVFIVSFRSIRTFRLSRAPSNSVQVCLQNKIASSLHESIIVFAVTRVHALRKLRCPHCPWES